MLGWSEPLAWSKRNTRKRSLGVRERSELVRERARGDGKEGGAGRSIDLAPQSYTRSPLLVLPALRSEQGKLRFRRLWGTLFRWGSILIHVRLSSHIAGEGGCTVRGNFWFYMFWVVAWRCELSKESVNMARDDDATISDTGAPLCSVASSQALP